MAVTPGAILCALVAALLAALAARWSCRAAAAACGASDCLPGHQFAAPPVGFFDRRHHCRRRVEAPIPALAAGLAFLAASAPPLSCWGGLVTAVIAAAAVIDHYEELLPDFLTQPLMFGGLLAAAAAAPFCAPAESICGAAGAWLLGSAVALLRRLASGRDGLGGGDIRMFAAVGAWFGPLGVTTVILAAGLILLAWTVAWRLAGQIPAILGHHARLGPFLACGVAAWPWLRPLFHH